MGTLYVYNTLSKRKERFNSLKLGEVRIYTCGLTVNDYMHIGHARTYVVWDVVVRYLQYLGYKVYHVSNVTDVSIDDKILRRIKELKISYQQLVEKFTRAYFEDREALGIAKADVHPLVTQHIQEIIEFIEKLIQKGYAYVAEDGVYFKIGKFKDYGKLSGIKLEELRFGASGRVKTDEYEKEEVGDFVLWKKAKTDEPYWYSPWGKGRPGWHIECSAMALKYLGETFDIHAGGEDNIFPHHENEIAQSEALTGKPFAKYWLHTRHVLLNGRRMSKSEKNYITAREAIAKYGAALLRLYLLTVHYRRQLDFREEALLASKRQLERLKNALLFLEQFITYESKKKAEDETILLAAMKKAKKAFEEAMNDDFNTPLAINAIIGLAKQVINYRYRHSAISIETKKQLLEFFGKTGEVIFGDLYESEILPKIDENFTRLVETLIEERNDARKHGKYELADRIRAKLAEAGILLEDTTYGTVWKLKVSRL